MPELSKIALENLPEWQMIEYQGNLLIKDYTAEIIALAERGETAQMCERAGRIAGIQEILTYPEVFAGGKHAKESDKKAG